MKMKANILKIMYKLTMVMALVAVNTTCSGRYYQEEMDSQLDSLRKYHEE